MILGEGHSIHVTYVMRMNIRLTYPLPALTVEPMVVVPALPAAIPTVVLTAGVCLASAVPQAQYVQQQCRCG
jgi:hypothetical protein